MTLARDYRRAARPRAGRPPRPANDIRVPLSSMSKEERVRELLIAMVPQWYVAKGGPNPYELGGLERAFHSVRPLTPKLRDLRRWMNSNFSRWVEELPQTPSPSSYASITEEIAMY